MCGSLWRCTLCPSTDVHHTASLWPTTPSISRNSSDPCMMVYMFAWPSCLNSYGCLVTWPKNFSFRSCTIWMGDFCVKFSTSSFSDSFVGLSISKKCPWFVILFFHLLFCVQEAGFLLPTFWVCMRLEAFSNPGPLQVHTTRSIITITVKMWVSLPAPWVGWGCTWTSLNWDSTAASNMGVPSTSSRPPTAMVKLQSSTSAVRLTHFQVLATRFRGWTTIPLCWLCIVLIGEMIADNTSENGDTMTKRTLHFDCTIMRHL